jgi:hypothetical protein
MEAWQTNFKHCQSVYARPYFGRINTVLNEILREYDAMPNANASAINSNLVNNSDNDLHLSTIPMAEIVEPTLREEQQYEEVERTREEHPEEPEEESQEEHLTETRVCCNCENTDVSVWYVSERK